MQKYFFFNYVINYTRVLLHFFYLFVVENNEEPAARSTSNKKQRTTPHRLPRSVSEEVLALEGRFHPEPPPPGSEEESSKTRRTKVPRKGTFFPFRKERYFGTFLDENPIPWLKTQLFLLYSIHALLDSSSFFFFLLNRWRLISC